MHSLFSKSCHWPPCPWRSGLFKALSAALLAGLLTACVSPPNKAPVEDRSAAKLAGKAESTPTLSSEPVAGSGVPVDAVKLLPGAENAGKPGYYTVKPGDTLIRVGLENGQNWRDVLRWNALENPNLIEVGQVLRVVPPGLDAGAVAADLETVYGLFPILQERAAQVVNTLSGGQQQMVAIGRALMGKPALLLLDEPSVGIAHRLKMEIFDAIKRIQQGGVAILMAEQDAQSALRIADRVYVLEHGQVGREGTSAELGADDYIRQAYLGVG
jgi:LysM repeat protein